MKHLPQVLSAIRKLSPKRFNRKLTESLRLSLPEQADEPVCSLCDGQFTEPEGKAPYCERCDR